MFVTKSNRSCRVSYAQITQSERFAVFRVPKVDAGSKTDGDIVLRRPIDEVEVEIVLQGRCLEDLEGHLLDPPVLIFEGNELLPELHAREPRFDYFFCFCCSFPEAKEIVILKDSD